MIIVYIVCALVCVCVLEGHKWHVTHVSQWMTFWILFFPSIFKMALGIELRLLCLDNKHLYLLSHRSIPKTIRDIPSDTATEWASK